MKAKQTSTGIKYASNYMYIESIGAWVTNPTDKMLADDGYIDVPDFIGNETEPSASLLEPAPAPAKQNVFQKIVSFFKK